MLDGEVLAIGERKVSRGEALTDLLGVQQGAEQRLECLLPNAHIDVALLADREESGFPRLVVRGPRGGHLEFKVDGAVVIFVRRVYPHLVQ